MAWGKSSKGLPLKFEAEWLAAARWKARGRLSLADAIALAIAETRNIKLVCADHHELDPLEASIQTIGAASHCLRVQNHCVLPNGS
ncbi:MAG: hypothetical protein ACYCTY_00900 [Sulfuricella sp.]